MKRITIILFILNISTIINYAQNFTLSGIVSDSLSQENLVAVTLVEKNKNIFTTCNQYGFYSISLPKGKNTLNVILLGYQNKTIKINIKSDTILNIKLLPSDIALQQVIVRPENTKLNIYRLPMSKINKMPVIAGETDVLKSLQLTPGVSAGNEGSASLNIRGGSPEQNLYLLDGIPVYNVNHAFGFFSVFNTDALKSVKLIKGGIPAQYHGRVSSIVDLYMKEGDLEHFHGNFTIGLISSKIVLEGPIVKNKSSFIVTGRRTYADIFFRPISKMLADGMITGYYFYDINAKWNYKFSDRSRIYFSFYGGKDKGFTKSDDNYKSESNILSQKTSQDLIWGNQTLALRWVKIITNKLSMNNTVYYTKFKYNHSDEYFLQEKVEADTISKSYNIYNGSGINDLGYKLNFDYFIAQSQKIKFGATLSHKNFFPSFSSEQFFDNSSINDTIIKDFQESTSDINAYEYSFYIQDEFNIRKINTLIGLNANGFSVNNKLYYFIEPRISLIYKFSNKVSLQTSYSSVHQYLHLLINTSLGLPTDLWVPATENLKPISSNIYDIGCKFNLPFNILTGISVYYKTLNNLIKYKQGTSFLDVKTNWQDKVTVGKGKAYGIEFSAQKSEGKISGQISYTYSRSFRTFENINNGNEFPYIYDRPHNFNIQMEYHLNKRFLITTNWILMSGHNMTYGYEQFVIDNVGEYNESFAYPYISGYNNIRLPVYHRLDIAFSFTKRRKKTSRIWYFGIYNVYNRLNPFYMEPSEQPNSLTGVSFAPITPFISYTVKF